MIPKIALRREFCACAIWRGSLTTVSDYTGMAAFVWIREIPA